METADYYYVDSIKIKNKNNTATTSSMMDNINSEIIKENTKIQLEALISSSPH